MEEIEKLKIENEKLKKLNENKSDIISITAHQLRTSLSALKWIFKMFIDEDVGKLTNEQDELMQKAYKSNERMLNLVNDLLNLSHSEDASVSYNFKKINIINIVEQTIFEFSVEANKKQVDLILLKPEIDISFVSCDEEMIRIVFQNLIENAIKYSIANGKVFVSIKPTNDSIQISIKDNGIGINISDKENIFKKFYRAPNAKEKDIIGSGLGLFTTKNIVEKHNGKIWFENEEGKGTTFFVLLPIIK
jgi:signal transduction histidine kinase